MWAELKWACKYRTRSTKANAIKPLQGNELLSFQHPLKDPERKIMHTLKHPLAT